MPAFNLIDEPWIPCRSDGEVSLLGLRGTLTEAHQLEEVWHGSPLVTAAITRLLIAVLHRALAGPVNDQEWRDLWASASFNPERLDRYLQSQVEAFDLFNSDRPFFQVSHMHKQRSPGTEVELHPVQLLVQEAATGNNATLFDHSRKDRPVGLHPAEAAQYLLARHAYSLGLGVSEPFNFRDAPVTRGYTVMARGNSLFETLMLNLLPQPRWYQFEASPDDRPTWEDLTPPDPDPKGTRMLGRLHYLTWQSRRIHLIQDSDGLVRYCQLQQGHALPKSPPTFDPFKAFRGDSQAGFTPFGFRRERALWRDSETLFSSATSGREERKRPAVLDHLAQIDIWRQDRRIEAAPAYAIDIYGIATDPGKATSVILWRHERLPLPLTYLHDEALRAEIEVALRLADEVGRGLSRAVRRYATFLRIPNYDQLSPDQQRKAENEPQTRRQIDGLAQGLRPELWYWPILEPAFHHLLITLPTHRVEADGDVSYGTALSEWATAVRDAARNAYATATAGAGADRRSLKAVAMAGHVFNRAIARSLAPFFPDQDETEEEIAL